MGIKDAIRQGRKNNSPFFRAVYKTYRWGVNRMYDIDRTMKPLDEHLVLFEAFQGRQYTCSPKAIYLEMLRDPKYSSYRFIWALTVEAKEKNHLERNDRTEVVIYNSRDYRLAYARAKYIFTNSMPLGFYTPRKGQHLVETWHGTPLKRLGCDIAVDSNEINTAEEIHNRYRERVQKITEFISPSDFYTEKLSSAFDLHGAGKAVRMIQKGYPRNDFLTNYTEEDVRTIKSRLGIPEGKKVILYAPTFRDNQKLDKAYSYSFTLEMDFDHLLETLGDEYVVLFRPHYFVASQFDFAKYAGKVFNVADVDDVNEVYVVSDLLITDYSSVFFDYAILKRPILLFMYDLELYQGQLRDFYIDLNTLPFPIVRRQEELEEKLLEAFHGGFAYDEAYGRFNETYTPMDDGKAAQRVLEELIPPENA